MCTTNQTSLHFLWKTNAGKSLTSVCSVSTLEGVEFSSQIVLKLWEAVKGGKFFYFVPSSCLVFIICPTFLALSATPAHPLCPHTQCTTSLSYSDQPLTFIFSPAYSLVQHTHSLGAAPPDSRLLHRLPWFFLFKSCISLPPCILPNGVESSVQHCEGHKVGYTYFYKVSTSQLLRSSTDYI